MHIELINTGSELLRGQTQNTHQSWIANQLSDRGYLLSQQCTVPDTSPAIQQALKDALQRADLVITTGGLGPTSDDRTRDFLAELIQRPLKGSTKVLESIRTYFEKRGKPLPSRVAVQALIPEGASYLINGFGTAPGLLISLNPNPFSRDKKEAWIAMFPGPPRELHPMFRDQFIPWLLKNLPRNKPYHCHILRTSGLGESWVEERLAPKLQHLVEAGLDIGYCARSGEVDVRFSAEGSQADVMVKKACDLTHDDLGALIYGEGETSLESALVHACRKHGQTIALAESCTGGFIAHRITNVSGASEILHGGVVSYANKAKQQWLDVSSETLETHGAVSEATAHEMLKGILKNSGASIGLAITGIAGPTGGTDEKPVGTVYMAVGDKSHIHVCHKFNPYDRETFKFVSSNQALELLRRKVLNLPLVHE